MHNNLPKRFVLTATWEVEIDELLQNDWSAEEIESVIKRKDPILESELRHFITEYGQNYSGLEYE